MTKERCRAKKRSECRYHSARDRLQNAIKSNSATDYFDASEELAALAQSNWIEGGWGFTRPADRDITSPEDVTKLLESKEVLADAYTATFDYGTTYSGHIRRAAKKHGIMFSEEKYRTPSERGSKFHLIATSRRDLRFMLDLFAYNTQVTAELEDQARSLGHPVIGHHAQSTDTLQPSDHSSHTATPRVRA